VKTELTARSRSSRSCSGAEYVTAELGYEIVETNFDAQKGEFDIIAKSDSILVFIKVKTRTNQKSGFGVDQISSRKVQHLQATALRYIKKVSNFDVDID